MFKQFTSSLVLTSPVDPAGVARAEWKAATQFHPLDSGAVLEEILRRVREAVATRRGEQEAQAPLVVFDLDSTLYDVSPRMLQIVQDWSRSEEAQGFPQVVRALRGVQLKHVGYSVRDVFRSLQVDGPESLEAHERLRRYWAKHFFRNEYLAYDQVYEGAVEFVQEVYEAGARVVYLTGREESSQGRGTQERIEADGFPWGRKRAHLVMKRGLEYEDWEHKVRALHEILGGSLGGEIPVGKLIASFENEPPNLAALVRAFPESMHVWMETVCSERRTQPLRGVYHVTDFKRGKLS
jgi:hypothetical protein